MTLSKAKQILLNKERQLLTKAEGKRREADRLEEEAKEIRKEADKLQ